MNKPKVSILIPVYNREEYISECVQSALDQTYSNIEIIIVDNASTDNTWKICQEFADKDSRVKIFQNKKNIGPVLNWQRCFEEAKGQYGKILFSDDLLLENCLEISLAMMHDNVGFVLSSVLIGTNIEKSNVMHLWKKKSGFFNSKTFIEDAIWRNCGGIAMSPGAALFRMNDLLKHLLLNIKGTKYNDYLNHGAGPDFLVYLLTAIKYEKIGFSCTPLSFFRSHLDSITVKKSSMVSARYDSARFFFSQYVVRDKQLLKRMLMVAWFRRLKIKCNVSFNFFCLDEFLIRKNIVFSDMYHIFFILWNIFKVKVYD